MFYRCIQSKNLYHYVGKTYGGLYVLADKFNETITAAAMDKYVRMPDECKSFDYVPPVPTKKLEIKYGGPIFTRVVGSTVVDCDKIDCGPDLYDNLKQLINTWSLNVFSESKNLTIEPANFLLVFCGSKYNVSKRQIKEFLED